MRLPLVPLVLVVLFTAPVGSSAAPLLPAGASPELDAQMAQHARQFYYISALPFGLSLDVHPRDEADVAVIDQFLAQTDSDDFATVTGSHPYEAMGSYGEYGDLGFFGGVAVAGTAYEYLTLKKEGATEDRVALARERLVRAAESWHVFKVVTGGGGLVARGIGRVIPEDPDAPPMPAMPKDPVPLADEEGNPLPAPKTNGSWRADNSDGELPEGVWQWVDSCSKDQLVGQVFAMAALYDAMKDDPDIDQALVDDIVEDARVIAGMLMTKREISGMEGIVGQGEYDLIIMDADGRPTMYHDLNPLSVEKFYAPLGAPTFNVFNLFMSIGIFTALHHMTGDEAIEAFLYEELLANRGFLEKAGNTESSDAVDYVYMGTRTNFDAPDMTAIALFLGLYLQTDAEVSAVLRAFFEERWWDRPDESHTARLCKQPLWHAIYLAVTDQGTDQGLVDELVDLLLGFDLGPYWNPSRINCDEDELEAGECLAIDGETVIVIDGYNERGGAMAAEALHPSIRPPSNFDARSNPFAVNGGGGLRLNPGGDLLASYWLARYFEATEPGAFHLSPFAREHMPVGGWPEPSVEPVLERPMTQDVSGPIRDYVAPAPDVVTDITVHSQDGGGGGGCSTGTAQPSGLLALLLLVATLAVWRARPSR